METYRVAWNPSPDDFVDKLQVLAKVDGSSSYTVLADNIGSGAGMADIDFVTGAVVDGLIVRAFGDNGEIADSTPLPQWTAVNLAKLRPVSGVTVTWQKHTP